MSDCCGPTGCEVETGEQTQLENCPVSKTKGQKVAQPTVRAMLTTEAMKNLKNVDYRYCSDPDCDVVYFGPDSIFKQADLSQKVTQKSKTADTPVCFCYGYSRGSIESDIKAGGSGPAAEISQFVKQGLCACDVRNPQGTCCLGNVAAVVRELS